MRVKIARRLCVSAATRIAREEDGALSAIDCAAFWQPTKRSKSSSGEPSNPHTSRGVCMLPIDTGQLLRPHGGQRRRLFPCPAVCYTQPPTRP
ncbi:hypothetical protein WAE31_20140 (plasmid) [Xanthomonas axonopodis pv. vasculorum]